MPQKGNLAIFEGSNISKTGETTPTKIGVHALDINSYLQAWVKYMTIVFNYNYKHLENVRLQIQIQILRTELYFNYKYKYWICISNTITNTCMPPMQWLHACIVMQYMQYIHACHIQWTGAIFKMAAVDSLDSQVLYHCKIN